MIVMSLERIDRYIRELKAIRDYPAKCQELKDVDFLAYHLQTELDENEEIISLCKATIEKQRSSIIFLQNSLKEALVEMTNLRRVGAMDENLQACRAGRQGCKSNNTWLGSYGY